MVSEQTKSWATEPQNNYNSFIVKIECQKSNSYHHCRDNQNILYVKKIIKKLH